jgi:hypothetical protein
MGNDGGETAPGIIATSSRGPSPCRESHERLREQMNPALASQVGCLLSQPVKRIFSFPLSRSTHCTGISGQDTPRDSTKFNPSIGVRWMPKALQAPLDAPPAPPKNSPRPKKNSSVLAPLWRESPERRKSCWSTALTLRTVASRRFPSPHVPTLRQQKGSHDTDCVQTHASENPSDGSSFSVFAHDICCQSLLTFPRCCAGEWMSLSPSRLSAISPLTRPRHDRHVPIFFYDDR